MSLHVCACCGWSKMTTYRGLRIHQGKNGCTPKGISIPKNLYGLSYSPDVTFTGPTIQLQEPLVDIFTTSIMSDLSSDNITTYQGPRIHQEKVGFTPNRTKVSEIQQFRFKCPPWEESTIQLQEPNMDYFNTPKKTDSSSGEKLQVLSYSNSKFTTDQTLQKDCSSDGINVPKKMESKCRDLQLQPEVLARPPTTIIQESEIGPQDKDEETEKSLTLLHNLIIQHSPKEEVQTDTVETFFQSPQHSQQSTNNSGNVRRTLNFVSGSQHEQRDATVQKYLKNQTIPHALACPPTTTAQEAAPGPKGMVQEDAKGRKDVKKAEMQQKIQTREQMVAEVRSSLKNCKILLDAQWVEINSIFSEVIKVVEEARQKALQPLAERRRTVKREAQDLVKKLEKEIKHLKVTIEDMDTKPNSQFCLDKYREWTNIELDTEFSFGSLKTTTNTMMEGIQQKLEKLSNIELRRFSKFTVDVKLDPLTAHNCLVVSDDGKRVRDGGKPTKLPATQERFDMFGSVMADKSLSFGRSYWEVVVGNKPGWDLGVARGQVNRTGRISLNPKDGYWVIVHYEKEKYAALTAPPLSLSLKENPKKVGVFVDYIEGLISFYNVTAQSHIYTFTGCLFKGEIFPYFSPHLNQNGENADPLIICS